MAISETVLILAGGTAILSTLFGIRLAMRAVAGALRCRGKQSRIYTAMEERPDEAAIDKPKGLLKRSRHNPCSHDSEVWSRSE
jgi:hypothetical protein